MHTRIARAFTQPRTMRRRSDNTSYQRCSLVAHLIRHLSIDEEADSTSNPTIRQGSKHNHQIKLMCCAAGRLCSYRVSRTDSEFACRIRDHLRRPRAALGRSDPRSPSESGRPAAVAQIITRVLAHLSSPAGTRESLRDCTARCAPSRCCSLRCAAPCTMLARQEFVGIDSRGKLFRGEAEVATNNYRRSIWDRSPQGPVHFVIYRFF